MTTHGVVAIGNKDRWVGIYNQQDSYPSCLGKDVWDTIKEYGNLNKFVRDLLKYDDWINFLNKGVCPYCGKKGFGRPYNMVGLCEWTEGKTEEGVRKYFEHLPYSSEYVEQFLHEPQSIELRDNIERTNYPDPECKYHNHEKLRRTDKITSERPGEEWIYVVDPIAEQIIVMTGQYRASDKPIRRLLDIDRLADDEDWIWNQGFIDDRYAVVTVVDLNGKKPDWNKIHHDGDDMKEV